MIVSVSLKQGGGVLCRAQNIATSIRGTPTTVPLIFLGHLIFSLMALIGDPLYEYDSKGF